MQKWTNVLVCPLRDVLPFQARFHGRDDVAMIGYLHHDGSILLVENAALRTEFVLSGPSSSLRKHWNLRWTTNLCRQSQDYPMIYCPNAFVSRVLGQPWMSLSGNWLVMMILLMQIS
jgi:hypothetical protein